ncbi:seven-hairpin glycosidase [Neoconidiobolus thromboides FSU 785]|nr:seven-hairpin glycosidase [Neoconidiobolus thromboides FSU 785]
MLFKRFNRLITVLLLFVSLICLLLLILSYHNSTLISLTHSKINQYFINPNNPYNFKLQYQYFNTKKYLNQNQSLLDIEINKYRSNKIKDTFMHAWLPYRKQALGHDNLKPISKKVKDEWGVTLVDSLDTLILMNLTYEYQLALSQISTINYKKQSGQIIVFETIIRHLGGLISSYDLTQDTVLLKKAIELADVLLPAFDTPFGYPVHLLNLNNKNEKMWTNNLAEIASLQLEFHRLSQLSKNPIYAKKAQTIIDNLDKANNKQHNNHGLFPLEWDLLKNKPITDAISFGAFGDSFYEYLLKRYLLTKKTEDQYKRLYTSAIDSFYKYVLIQRDETNNNLLLISDLYSLTHPRYEMDHFACFVPGMLMLGSIELNRKADFSIAIELLLSCYQLYHSSPIGLAPDKVKWEPSFKENIDYNQKVGKENNKQGNDKKKKGWSGSKNGRNEYFHLDPSYRLRPEFIESLYYAYYFTRNPIFQQWAWEVFENIEQHCKVEFGYSELNNVFNLKFNNRTKFNDRMESFFLAETLKYFYLIFNIDLINLNEYVFTTEAHPLKMDLKVFR